MEFHTHGTILDSIITNKQCYSMKIHEYKNLPRTCLSSIEKAKPLQYFGFFKNSIPFTTEKHTSCPPLVGFAPIWSILRLWLDDIFAKFVCVFLSKTAEAWDLAETGAQRSELVIPILAAIQNTTVEVKAKKMKARYCWHCGFQIVSRYLRVLLTILNTIIKK